MNETPPPVRKRRWWLRVLIAIVVIQLLGFGIFGGMLWSWTDVERLDLADAEERFATALASAGGGPAYFDMPEHGDVIIHRELESASPPSIRALHGLVWQADRQRFVQLAVPGWFVRAKLNSSVGLEAFLRRLGMDERSRSGVHVEDLARIGHGLLVDERFGEGSRVLLWLEGEAGQ